MNLIRRILGLEKLETDVNTLTNHITDINRTVSFIKGQLYVLIPLVMALLAGMAALIYLGMT